MKKENKKNKRMNNQHELNKRNSNFQQVDRQSNSRSDDDCCPDCNCR